MSEAALRRIGHPRTGALRLASDARLVRIAVRGEQRAFAAIFQRYHQELYRYCRAILGDEEEASDALQNTMLKVMRALPGESREIALRPWLYRIAHNEAIALVRQRPPSAELSDEIAAPSASPLEHRVETRERLRQLVNDLQSASRAPAQRPGDARAQRDGLCRRLAPCSGPRPQSRDRPFTRRESRCRRWPKGAR